MQKLHLKLNDFSINIIVEKKRKKRRDYKPNNKDELRTSVLNFVSNLTADHKFGTYR